MMRRSDGHDEDGPRGPACSVAADQLSRYILGELDEPVNEQIRQHLAGGCDACDAKRMELEHLGHLINSASEDVDIPSHLWDSVRPSGPSTSRASSNIDPTVGTAHLASKGIGHYGFVLATACSFALATFVLRTWLSDETPRSISKIDELSGRMHDVRGANDPPARRVSVRSNTPSAEHRGSFLVDGMARQIHLVADGWHALEDDQRFVVWFVTADDTIIEGAPLTNIDVRSKLCLIDFPQTDAPLASIMVTVEHDDDWSNRRKQPTMASTTKVESARFVSDSFGDLLRRNI